MALSCRLRQSASDAIQVYLLPVSAQALSWIQPWEWILDAEEQRRAAAFCFARDRDTYRLAHVLLRLTLSGHAPVAPQGWQFTHNAYGRPEIANTVAMHHGLRFNLSHTEGLVACAVVGGLAIGIDVERHRHLPHLESLANYAFAPDEAAHVLAADPEPARHQRFYAYWTLKEAYIKGRGMGLALPLQKFAFRQRREEPWRLWCDPSLQDDGAAWQFALFGIGEGRHTMAVGIRRDEADDLPIIIHVIRPSEAAPDPMIICMSAQGLSR